MSECVSKYFIFDGVIEDISKFEEKIKSTGITIYEVIRVMDGVPLFIEQHLLRLENSAKLSGVFLKYISVDIKKQINLLIEKNRIREGNVKITINGSSSCAYFIKHKYPTDKMYIEGVETILFHGERNNPNVKYVNSDFRKIIEAEIISKNVYEAVLVDNNGYITEGSKSNIFMVKDNELITAPIKDVLPGVTRGKIIDIAKGFKIDIVEKNICFKDLFQMNAMFITGTSPKVLPISKVDDLGINSRLNPILIKIITEYDKLLRKYVNLNKNITI